MEEGAVTILEPLGKESLGYRPGTKEGGILGQGNSINNSLDGKECGVFTEAQGRSDKVVEDEAIWEPCKAMPSLKTGLK